MHPRTRTHIESAETAGNAGIVRLMGQYGGVRGVVLEEGWVCR